MKSKMSLGNIVICSVDEYYGLKAQIMDLEKKLKGYKERSKNHRYYTDRSRDLGETMNLINRAENSSEKVDVIDFVVKAIKNDIKYDYLTQILYFNNPGTFACSILPIQINNKKGAKIKAENKSIRAVSLKDDIVLTIPAEKKKLYRRIIGQKNAPFVYDPNCQNAKYYEPLGICTVVNGRHSIAAGAIYEKGEIEAEVIDISPLFKYMHTDGENWINTETDIVFKEVMDFRVAVIYELIRMKRKLLKNN